MRFSSKFAEGLATEPADLVDAGPCIKCGHPPRCHPERQCDAGLYSQPCGDYQPDPDRAIKLPKEATA